MVVDMSYFADSVMATFNGFANLPKNLTEQLVNPYIIFRPRDITTPNPIDLSAGMDFS